MKCYIHISLLQNTNLHQNIFIKQFSFNEMAIITAIVCNSKSAIKVQMNYKDINIVRLSGPIYIYNVSMKKLEISSCTIYETESVSLSLWALKYFLCMQCAMSLLSLSLSPFEWKYEEIVVFVSKKCIS